MIQDRLCPKCHNLVGRYWGKLCRRCHYLTTCTPCIDCGTLSDPNALRCYRCTNHRQRQDYDTDRLRALYDAGVKISEIGRLCGVSKNTISGYVWRQGWSRRYDGSTSMERLDALHDRMDTLLREYKDADQAGLVWIAPEPNKTRERAIEGLANV